MIFTLCIYRIDMVGNSHPEKADEKSGKVENHKNYKGKVFCMKRWRVPSV